jgi:hypothetical protein
VATSHPQGAKSICLARTSLSIHFLSHDCSIVSFPFFRPSRSADVCYV